MEEKKDIEALLKQGITVQFHPSGGSMAPYFVFPRDCVTIEPIGEDVKPLDVLVYRRPTGPLVIHRLYRKKKEGLYFVGDAQIAVEGPLSADCVLGKMTGFTRKGRERSVLYLPYRIYSRLWMILRPLRGVIFSIGHPIKLLIHKTTGRTDKK